jgi:hypothetical protein
MQNIGPTLIVVFGGIITLAMIAVAVSKNAQTSQVISGAGSALSSVITAAVAPVSGSGTGGTFGSTTPTAGVSH